MEINSIYEHHVVIEKALEEQLFKLESELDKAKKLVSEKESLVKETRAALNAIRGVSDYEIDKSETVAGADKPLRFIESEAPEWWESEWTWENKIKKLLDTAGRPLSTTDMADTIMKYEPWRERTKVVASISAVLSQKSKAGGVFTKTTDLRGNFIYTIANDDNLPF